MSYPSNMESNFAFQLAGQEETDLATLIRQGRALFSTTLGQFPPRQGIVGSGSIMLRSEPLNDVYAMAEEVRSKYPKVCQDITAPIFNIYEYYDHQDVQYHGAYMIQAVLNYIAASNVKAAIVFASSWKDNNTDRFFSISNWDDHHSIFSAEDRTKFTERFLRETLDNLKALRLEASYATPTSEKAYAWGDYDDRIDQRISTTSPLVPHTSDNETKKLGQQRVCPSQLQHSSNTTVADNFVPTSRYEGKATQENPPHPPRASSYPSTAELAAESKSNENRDLYVKINKGFLRGANQPEEVQWQLSHTSENARNAYSLSHPQLIQTNTVATYENTFDRVQYRRPRGPSLAYGYRGVPTGWQTHASRSNNRGDHYSHFDQNQQAMYQDPCMGRGSSGNYNLRNIPIGSGLASNNPSDRFPAKLQNYSQLQLRLTDAISANPLHIESVDRRAYVGYPKGAALDRPRHDHQYYDDNFGNALPKVRSGFHDQQPMPETLFYIGAPAAHLNARHNSDFGQMRSDFTPMSLQHRKAFSGDAHIPQSHEYMFQRLSSNGNQNCSTMKGSFYNQKRWLRRENQGSLQHGSVANHIPSAEEHPYIFQRSHPSRSDTDVLESGGFHRTHISSVFTNGETDSTRRSLSDPTYHKPKADNETAQSYSSINDEGASFKVTKDSMPSHFQNTGPAIPVDTWQGTTTSGSSIDSPQGHQSFSNVAMTPYAKYPSQRYQQQATEYAIEEDKVWVCGHIDRETIGRVFSAYASLREINGPLTARYSAIVDRPPFYFVSFHNISDAKAAITNLHNMQVRPGSHLVVKYANSRYGSQSEQRGVEHAEHTNSSLGSRKRSTQSTSIAQPGFNSQPKTPKMGERSQRPKASTPSHYRGTSRDNLPDDCHDDPKLDQEPHKKETELSEKVAEVGPRWREATTPTRKSRQSHKSPKGHESKPLHGRLEPRNVSLGDFVVSPKQSKKVSGGFDNKGLKTQGVAVIEGSLDDISWPRLQSRQNRTIQSPVSAVKPINTLDITDSIVDSQRINPDSTNAIGGTRKTEDSTEAIGHVDEPRMTQVSPVQGFLSLRRSVSSSDTKLMVANGTKIPNLIEAKPIAGFVQAISLNNEPIGASPDASLLEQVEPRNPKVDSVEISCSEDEALNNFASASKSTTAIHASELKVGCSENRHRKCGSVKQVIHNPTVDGPESVLVLLNKSFETEAQAQTSREDARDPNFPSKPRLCKAYIRPAVPLRFERRGLNNVKPIENPQIAPRSSSSNTANTIVVDSSRQSNIAITKSEIRFTGNNTFKRDDKQLPSDSTSAEETVIQNQTQQSEREIPQSKIQSSSLEGVRHASEPISVQDKPVIELSPRTPSPSIPKSPQSRQKLEDATHISSKFESSPPITTHKKKQRVFTPTKTSFAKKKSLKSSPKMEENIITVQRSITVEVSDITLGGDSEHFSKTLEGHEFDHEARIPCEASEGRKPNYVSVEDPEVATKLQKTVTEENPSEDGTDKEIEAVRSVARLGDDPMHAISMLLLITRVNVTLLECQDETERGSDAIVQQDHASQELNNFGATSSNQNYPAVSPTHATYQAASLPMPDFTSAENQNAPKKKKLKSKKKGKKKNRPNEKTTLSLSEAKPVMRPYSESPSPIPKDLAMFPPLANLHRPFVPQEDLVTESLDRDSLKNAAVESEVSSGSTTLASDPGSPHSPIGRVPSNTMSDPNIAAYYDKKEAYDARVFGKLSLKASASGTESTQADSKGRNSKETSISSGTFSEGSNPIEAQTTSEALSKLSDLPGAHATMKLGVILSETNIAALNDGHSLITEKGLPIIGTLPDNSSSESRLYNLYAKDPDTTSVDAPLIPDDIISGQKTNEGLKQSAVGLIQLQKSIVFPEKRVLPSETNQAPSNVESDSEKRRLEIGAPTTPKMKTVNPVTPGHQTGDVRDSSHRSSLSSTTSSGRPKLDIEAIMKTANARREQSKTPPEKSPTHAQVRRASAAREMMSIPPYKAKITIPPLSEANVAAISGASATHSQQASFNPDISTKSNRSITSASTPPRPKSYSQAAGTNIPTSKCNSPKPNVAKLTGIGDDSSCLSPPSPLPQRRKKNMETVEEPEEQGANGSSVGKRWGKMWTSEI